MSRAAYNLQFFPRRRSGFEDAGFAVEQFSQVITGDCFVYSKHTSHLFLMLDFDPQSPDHTSVHLSNRLLAPMSKACQGAKTIFFFAHVGAMAPLVRGGARGSCGALSTEERDLSMPVAGRIVGCQFTGWLCQHFAIISVFR